MRKIIWMLVLMVTSHSFMLANDCPEVIISVTENELEIENLTAPITIVKIFNASYNLVYQCNGNCLDEIELDNLSKGEYYIDIQSYTNNWRFICDQKETIIIGGNSVSDCSAIEVEVEENELIISGLNAPNKIVKIFDVFYNVIDVCFFNCPRKKIIPNLLSGIYHIDIQLYTANWQFICSRQEDVTVALAAELCDDSVCLGNIRLTTQAAVDELCACPIIEGDLIIGDLTRNSDITSLANLQKIERVNGTVSILNTTLKNLEGLGNLGIIKRDLRIINNQFLKDGEGLNNLVSIGQQFQLKENARMENLNGFDRWTKAKKIDFQNNNKLEGVEELAQITNLQELSIQGLNQLRELPELIVDSLFGLTLVNNLRLKNLTFLEPINYLEGRVIIKNNSALSNCCGLSHLLDEDTFFGSNNANFTIDNNPFTCISTTNVLAACLPNAPTCADIRMETTTDKMTISGLTAANEIIKIFDENYTVLFSCFGDCEEEIALIDLAAGTYRIYVNFYNQNWIPICETIITVNLDEEDATVSFNDRNSALTEKKLIDVVLSPNPALGATFVDLKAFENESVQLRLMNQFGQEVWQRYIGKASNLPEKIEVHTFQNGIYFLQIQPDGRRGTTKKLIVNRLY